MAADIIITALANNIKADSDIISINFGTQPLPLDLGGGVFNNIRSPVFGIPTQTILGFRNVSLSGFRFNHITDLTNNLGDFYLQTFINNTATDLIKFTSTSAEFIGLDIDLHGNKIVNGATPVSDNDYTTKQYVDDAVAGTGGGTGPGSTWTGNVIAPLYGGTGVANDNSKTITLGGTIKTEGDFETREVFFTGGGVIINGDFGTSRPGGLDGNLNFILQGDNTVLTLPLFGTIATLFNRIDQFTVPITDVQMGGNTFIGLAEPIVDTSPATKIFVETKIITLTGDITGTGTLGAGIINTTLSTIAASKLAGYPNNTTTFLRGDGSWVVPSGGVGPGDTWTGNIIQPIYGGTGIANLNTNTITLGGIIETGGELKTTGVFFVNGNLDINGNFGTVAIDGLSLHSLEFTLQGNTAVTLPTFGTLATLFNRLDQFGIPTTSLNLNNNKIINLITPIALNDAANKEYVDNLSRSITGAVIGSGSGVIDVLLNNNLFVQGSNQIFNYEDNLSTLTLYNTSNNYSNGRTSLNLQQNVTPFVSGGVTVFGIQAVELTLIANSLYPSTTLSPTISLDMYLNVDPSPSTTTKNIFKCFLTSSGYLNSYNVPVSVGDATTTIVANVMAIGGVQNVALEESCIRAISNTNATKIELQCTNGLGRLYELRSDSGGNFVIYDRTSGIPRLRLDSQGNYYGSRPSVYFNMQNNVAGTVLPTANVFVKLIIGGTTTIRNNAFIVTGNKFTFNGPQISNILIQFVVLPTHNGVGTDNISFKFYLNGTIAINESLVSYRNPNIDVINNPTPYIGSVLLPMSTSDFIEVWVAHPTAGRTVVARNMTITATAT